MNIKSMQVQGQLIYWKQHLLDGQRYLNQQAVRCTEFYHGQLISQNNVAIVYADCRFQLLL